jgi:hypothetical protein
MMKILLLGEYSGIHNNLKDGLVALGHECDVASAGDNWKKIETDINLDCKFSGILGKAEYRINWLRLLKDIEKYDVVHLVNPFAIPWKLFPAAEFVKRISKVSNLYLSAAGDDAYFWRFGKKKLAYGPFDDFLKYDEKCSSYFMESDASFDHNNNIIEHCRGIIPIMYEYEKSYEGHPKLLKTIPIAINANKIKYSSNIINDKIVVFHGLNKYGFKGTRFVEKAFHHLKNKYPNSLDLRIEGNLPFDQYTSLLQNTNIVIDQVNGYSCGVNALISLAMGKIVLGGAEEIGLTSLNQISTPVFNITPKDNSISDTIEYLIENKNDFEALGLLGRKFVIENHCHIKIAEEYLRVWNLNNK